jgi:hypothetical protein
VERIPVAVAESPKEDHLDRPLDADLLVDETSRLRGAELCRDVK